MQVMHMLPQPRALPKVAVWSMYCVLLSGSIAAILILLNFENNEQKKEDNENSTSVTKRMGMRNKRPKLNNQKQYYETNHALITLEDIIGYQCHYEHGLNQALWIEESNIKGTTSSNSSIDRNDTYVREGLDISLSKDISSLLICHKDVDKNDEDCRFSLRVLGSNWKKESTDSLKMISQFSKLVQGRSGDYTYTYVNGEPLMDQHFRHKSQYKIRLKPHGIENESNFSNLCILKLLEEYEFTWNSRWFQPKYTFSEWQNCPTYSLSYTDEFILNGIDSRHRWFDYFILPVAFLPHHGIIVSPLFTDSNVHITNQNWKENGKELRIKENEEFLKIGKSGWVIHLIIERDELRNRSNMNIAISKDTILSKFVKDSKWIPRISNQDYKPLVTNDLHVLKIVAVMTASEDEAQVFFLASPVANVSRRLLYQLKVVSPPLEFVTHELLHCLTCPDGPHGDPTSRNEGGYMLSRLGNRPQCIWTDVEMKNMKSHYILHCRLLYQLKVVYPPLEFVTHELLHCLTCPDGPRGDPTSRNEGGYMLSRLGNRPQCIWTDVEMKNMKSHYILHCRGPDIPWASLVSRYNNVVVKQFNVNLRKDVQGKLNWKLHSRKFEFKVDLGKGYQVRARLYVPSDWKGKKNECGEKFIMLLRVAEKQEAQLIDAKYILSVTTYLTNTRRYAVLYVDTRGSKFESLDFLKLRFKRRESMQLLDYLKAAKFVVNEFGCINQLFGFGVFGEAYGGHMALNLLITSNTFSCAVAVKPSLPWQLYVYPFHEELSEGTIGQLRRKLFKLQHLVPLVQRLRNDSFAICTMNLKSTDHDYYLENMFKLLKRRSIQFKHQEFDELECDSRLKLLYEWIGEYFDRCFYG